MSRPDFWQDQNQAKRVSQQAEIFRQTVSQWEILDQTATDLLSLAQTAEQEGATEMASALTKDFAQAKKEFEKLEFLVLFSGPHDINNAIVSLHAGSGGVEAQDWVAMLLRMYLRYCERRGFEAKVIDESRGQEAGFKSLSLEVIGAYAYGYLKSEAGVHRLVRISPFDAEKMRHTSFALVEVIPELAQAEIAEIKEEDLKIETMRAGGHGGQSVNTTDSAVRITHLPTGIVVKCQNERSQLQNKQTALRHLQAKLAQRQNQQHQQTVQDIRGEVLSAEWGNQIRSYVLQPYKMVKDHRTDFTSLDPAAILAGGLDELVESYLKYQSQSKSN